MPSWPAIRAALLAVVLLAQAVVAQPFGHRVTPASLAKPSGKAEVDAWMRLAGPLGFTRQGFEGLLVDASDRLSDLDEALNAPLTPFVKATKTGQSWGLFAVPDATPIRLTVTGEDAAGVERILYRRLDGEHAWLRGPLDYRRVRGVYDLGGDKRALPPRYKNFARWVADRAFEDHPDLVRVRVHQTRTTTTPPTEPVPDAKPVDLHVAAFSREDG